MTIRSVMQLGTPSLWEPSAPVTDPADPAVAALVDDLHDTLLHWRATTTYGRGIAAPQIGVLRRVVVLDLRERWPLLNAQIVRRSPTTLVLWDACLSFLDLFGQVLRHAWIDVRWQALDGAWHEHRFDGELSELLQHEIDHLDGILAVARVLDVHSLCTREQFELRHRATSPYARPTA
jgi:peptide deformylase